MPKARPLVHNLLLSFVMLPLIGVLLIVAIALPVLLSITVRATGFAEGAQLNEWNASTFYSGGAAGYIDYPVRAVEPV